MKILRIGKIWEVSLVLLVLFLQTATLLAANALYVHQIVIHPERPQILYASTDNDGVLKSSDGGTSWRPANNGIKSYLLYQLLIDPGNPEILYTASWGGGVYKSTNGGDSWEEKSRGLENTAIKTLFLAADGKTLYAASIKGVYRGKDSGEVWESLNSGLHLRDDEVVQCMLLIPSPKVPLLVMGTNRGIYRWVDGKAGWIRAGDNLEINTTSLTYDGSNLRIYAGTIGSGIYTSDDLGKMWKRYGEPGTVWINQIAIHPSHPGTLYVATRDRGLLKTIDNGKSWSEANSGIDDQWVHTVAFDPNHPKTIYAGTHENGIYKSEDGGKKWNALLKSTIQTKEARNAALLPGPEQEPEPEQSIPPPPEAIKKCSDCHGWTDQRLDFHAPTYYRVAANRRDWTAAVKRMSRQAQLTPDEERDILDYLNTYYGME